jgi:hypothetical protein
MHEVGSIFYILNYQDHYVHNGLYIYADLKINKTTLIGLTPKRQQYKYDPPLPKTTKFLKFSSIDKLKERLERMEESINEFLKRETAKFLRDYYMDFLGIKNSVEGNSKIVEFLKEHFLIGKMPLDIYEEFIENGELF